MSDGGASRGQAAPLLAAALLAVCLLALPAAAWAAVKGSQAYAQAAVDAAALAGARHALTAVQVDARGVVYARTTVVDPMAGPAAAAAAWQAALAADPSLATLDFAAVAQGATLTVRARVAVRAPGLGLLAAALARPAWTVTATAACRGD